MISSNPLRDFFGHKQTTLVDYQTAQSKRRLMFASRRWNWSSGMPNASEPDIAASLTRWIGSTHGKTLSFQSAIDARPWWIGRIVARNTALTDGQVAISVAPTTFFAIREAQLSSASNGARLMRPWFLSEPAAERKLPINVQADWLHMRGSVARMASETSENYDFRCV